MGSDLCDDAELAYERSRTTFAPGAGLTLDDGYRLAHLPLVAPGHPRAVAGREGTYYDHGRHPSAYSLVLPVPTDALLRSPAYVELDAALRAAPFADKVAWHVLDRRRSRLHATICGGLGTAIPVPIESEVRHALASLGPITFELRGLFSGNVNVGRLYLRVYPERRGPMNMAHAMQHAFGRQPTDLYVVGIWNLMDDLDPAEAAALSGLIEHWWSRPVLSFEADHLWMLGANDDLVLDSEIVEIVPLI